MQSSSVAAYQPIMLWTRLTSKAIYPWCLATVLALASASWSWAQDLSALPDSDDRWHDLLLTRDLIDTSRPSDSSSSAGRSQDRFRLFCMPSAFASNPLALDIDNDPPDESGASGASTPGDDFLQVSLGVDNPFFDFRRPGDPGGVGYYRLNSQLLLLDSRSAGLCLGMQAFTPAGLDADGLADGPTVLSPNFAWFYDVGDGNLLQGFVGKNLRARPGWTDTMERDIEYGLAFQRPFLRSAVPPSQNVQLFVEALGRYHFDVDQNQRSPNLNVVPGVHWQLGDAWWVSGGVLMPVGSAHVDSRLWQVTCSWQF
jgi:hypothetical protein